MHVTDSAKEAALQAVERARLYARLFPRNKHSSEGLSEPLGRCLDSLERAESQRDDNLELEHDSLAQRKWATRVLLGSGAAFAGGLNLMNLEVGGLLLSAGIVGSLASVLARREGSRNLAASRLQRPVVEDAVRRAETDVAEQCARERRDSETSLLQRLAAAGLQTGTILSETDLSKDCPASLLGEQVESDPQVALLARPLRRLMDTVDARTHLLSGSLDDIAGAEPERVRSLAHTCFGVYTLMSAAGSVAAALGTGLLAGYMFGGGIGFLAGMGGLAASFAISSRSAEPWVLERVDRRMRRHLAAENEADRARSEPATRALAEARQEALDHYTRFLLTHPIPAAQPVGRINVQDHEIVIGGVRVSRQEALSTPGR